MTDKNDPKPNDPKPLVPSYSDEDDILEDGSEEAPWYDVLYMLFIVLPVCLVRGTINWFRGKGFIVD